ncbi:MAG: hypothetical protein FJX46_13030 [Alphaproteobacteria bacterium]|nr:hypothetical protein [Alphaproteobacteria bacterium]
MKAIRAAILSLGLLAGCTAYEAIPGQPQAIGNGLSVVGEPEFNRRTGAIGRRAEFQQWTADGFELNALHLYGGIGEGETLSPVADRDNRRELPVFRANSNLAEAAEFVQASIAKLGGTALIEARDIRPIAFGGRDGFRFEFRITLKDEVERDGIAAGAVASGRLYLIFYHAPRQHYFERRKPAVERIIASARL